MRWVPFVAVLLLGAGTMVFYYAEMPWVAEIPGWFYRWWDKGVARWFLLVWGGLLGGAFAVGTHRLLGWRRDALAALVLVGASTILQLGTSWVGGTEEVLRRHESGHGTYWAVVAARRGQWLDTLLDFEMLAREHELGDFAPTKPPGVLLPYMAVDRVARVPIVEALLRPIADVARERERMAPYAETAALSIFLLPLCTALVAPAIVLLGRALFADDVAAWGGAVLWASAPQTLLVQYHLDGALYPLLAVTGCAAVAAGVRWDRLWLSMLGGAVLVLGLYTSFSLLVAPALAVGCAATVAIERARAGERSWPVAGDVVTHVLGATAAFAVGLALLTVWLRFDLVARYEWAMAYHARWKRLVPLPLWRAVALLEYALYVGVPLVGVWLWRTARAGARLASRRWSTADLASVGFLVLLLSLSAVAGTNEVCRMWSFLTPFLALSAATGLRALARAPDRWREPMAWLAAVQIAVAVFMKNFQEW